MRKKLSFTARNRPSGIRLMLMASKPDWNAVVNILADCCRAASALRKLSATRNCFSLVKTRRTMETKKDAVIAPQASVARSCAIRQLINRTSSGTPTGNALVKIVALPGEDVSSAMVSFMFHRAANAVTKRYGRHQATSYQFALPVVTGQLSR